MKLRNIIASFLAVVAIAAGCTQELAGNLSTIQLDQSTVVFPEQGGSVTITVTATTDWKVDTTTVPEEVTVTPMEGKAGETKMTISTAGGSLDDISADIVILVGMQKQFISFYQPGDPALKPQFDEFVAGDYWIMCQEGEEWFALKSTGCTIDDSGSYNYLYSIPAVVAEDGSLSSTASNVFTFEAVDGGFIIKDPAGGYLYQVAKYNNFYLTSDSAKASVWTVAQISDDEFMLEIPEFSKWMQYSTGYDSAGAYATAQEGATLPKLVRAEDPAVEPFVIEETEFSLPIEAGELVIPVTYNGTDIHVAELPEWLTFYGYHDGNIRFTYEENTGGNREATVVLVTCMDDGRESQVELTFVQEGSIIETTADVINAAEDGATLYRITGVVKSIVKTEYGNLYLADYTGEVYVYGTYDADGNRFDAFATPVNEGDIITVCGVKSSYNGSPQMKNVTLEKHIPVTAVTVDEFLAAAEATDVYYRLTGTMKNINLNDDGTQNVYGNFDLVDEAGSSVYVYGLLSGWGGPKKEFQSLGLKEGDVVTLIGVRTSYNGTAQVGSAFYVSHEAGASVPEVDVWTGENVVSYEMPEFMFTDYPQYCALTELKAYADETNLYARLKTTKTSGVAKLRLCTADTNEGTETVWYWENSFYSTPVYKSDKASVDTDFNFSLSYNGSPVELNTVVDGDNVYWEMTIPRAAHDHTSAAGAVNLGFVSYDSNGSENGLMPKVWGEMLEVTLP